MVGVEAWFSVYFLLFFPLAVLFKDYSSCGGRKRGKIYWLICFSIPCYTV